MAKLSMYQLALPAQGLLGDDRVPVGAVLAFMGTIIPAGWLLCDGREVNRADYHMLFQVIGTMYGAGNGVSTFTLPRLTDNRFLEGAPTAGTAKEAGLPNITGAFVPHGVNLGTSINAVYGAFAGSLLPNAYHVNEPTAGSQSYNSVDFDASRSSSVYGNASTVQPRALTVMYIIRAVDALNDSFAIIYPNNGSKSAPANVTVNTRYVEPNPFPGYHVHCVAELKVNGKWGEAGWIYNSAADTNGNGGYGVKASEYDGYVIVQTGGSALIAYSSNDGNPFGLGISNYPTVNRSTLPCRVKVWKVGRMEADE